MATFRSRSASRRYVAESRRYKLPGEVPTLPFHDYATTNPGLFSVPTIDLVALQAKQDAQQGAARDRRFDVLKAAKDFWPVAGADPGVADEIGGVLEDEGLPQYGAAMRRVRDEAPDLSGPTAPYAVPGQAPAIPGGDVQDEYAKRIGGIVAKFKRARPDLDHADHVKAAVEYLQHNPAWSSYKARLEGYGRERGQYDAKLDPEAGEPALISAKGKAERSNYRLATDDVVERTRRETATRQDEETEGAYNRESDKLDLEQTRGIPIRLFQKRREADIAFDLEGDKKALDYATDADIEEQRAIGRERGKRHFGEPKRVVGSPAARGEAAAAKAAGAAFDKDRELAHKDLEAWLQSSGGRNASPEDQRRYELEALRFRRNQRAQALSEVGAMRPAQPAPAAPTAAPATLTAEQIKRAQEYIRHPNSDPAKVAALKAKLAAAGVR